MSKFDDSDVDLPLEITHSCQWLNPADNDDPVMESGSNVLLYRFENGSDEIAVLVELDDPLAAIIMHPEHGCAIPESTIAYLQKRFEYVRQTTGDGFTILWESWQ